MCLFFVVHHLGTTYMLVCRSLLYSNSKGWIAGKVDGGKAFFWPEASRWLLIMLLVGQCFVAGAHMAAEQFFPVICLIPLFPINLCVRTGHSVASLAGGEERRGRREGRHCERLTPAPPRRSGRWGLISSGLSPGLASPLASRLAPSQPTPRLLARRPQVRAPVLHAALRAKDAQPIHRRVQPARRGGSRRRRGRVRAAHTADLRAEHLRAGDDAPLALSPPLSPSLPIPHPPFRATPSPFLRPSLPPSLSLSRCPVTTLHVLSSSHSIATNTTVACVTSPSPPPSPPTHLTTPAPTLPPAPACSPTCARTRGRASVPESRRRAAPATRPRSRRGCGSPSSARRAASAGTSSR